MSKKPVFGLPGKGEIAQRTQASDLSWSLGQVSGIPSLRGDAECQDLLGA